MLALDLPRPADMSSSLALATDDIALFVTGGRQAGDESIARIDEAVAARGIIKHPGKDVNYAVDATVIGVDLCDGRLLCPELVKLVRVLSGIVFLLTSDGQLTSDQLAALDGHLAWMALLNRPVFSALHAAYRFSRAGATEPMPLPDDVKAELWLFAALLPWVVGDLTRTWQDHLVCSDASPVFGFGVAVCRAPRAVVEQVARDAARPQTFVRLDRDMDDPDEEPEKPRKGMRVRIPLRKGAFKTVISARAAHAAHAGTLEAEAVTLALRWLLRSPARHGRRTTLLVDAKAVIGALARGRSSAPALRRAVMRTAALALGGDLLLHLVYVPSEDNAADAPSRGRALRRRAVGTPVTSKWDPRRSHLHDRVGVPRSIDKRDRSSAVRQATLEHLVWHANDASRDPL